MAALKSSSEFMCVVSKQYYINPCNLLTQEVVLPKIHVGEITWSVFNLLRICKFRLRRLLPVLSSLWKAANINFRLA